MTGNTLSEFIDDILTMGGPERNFFSEEKNTCCNLKLIVMIQN